ncbi:hypothetical protein KY347_00920 [Candidatus Woesearchaeota archaeon]|nr:hypothetical protein [Candidatus Woesearchaeota archaeon]
MTKKITLLGITALFVILCASFASAYFWGCFTKGEFIDFCYQRDRTCGATLCKFCMNNYDEINGCYTSTDFDYCNALVPDQQGCNTDGSGTVIDSAPPELDILSPLDGSMHTSRSIQLIYTLNENAHVYIYSGDRWSRICNDCFGEISQIRSFDEGDNELHLKAIDLAGLEGYADAHFIVDSQKPKISKTEPKKGYADGNFYAEFTEENPDTLKLIYGNSFREADVDLGACADLGKGKKGCSIFVDLTEFDGKDIQYWFNLTDIAGNFDASRPVELGVDTTPPEIVYLYYDIDGKFVNFDIRIDELNFDEITYTDSFDERHRWGSLCRRRLDDGACEKKVSFRDGPHILTINITDEAGNYVSRTLPLFHTDSKGPKITRTNPRSGFADGNFDVEFREENPVLLELNYGNLETGYRSHELSIEDDCFPGNGGKYQCNAFVELNDYDTEEIEYWFVIEDIVGSVDESKHISLDVDTTEPVISSLDYTIDGSYVTFTIEVNELNFDEVSYTDHSDSDRERRLCSTLREGICEARAAFSIGRHDLTVTAADEAGNSVGEPVSFDIV